jgi:hypothetical protein
MPSTAPDIALEIFLKQSDISLVTGSVTPSGEGKRSYLSSVLIEHFQFERALDPPKFWPTLGGNIYYVRALRICAWDFGSANGGELV